MDIEPTTREELFMAKAAKQNVKTPEPCTRREIFLQAIAESAEASGNAQSTLAWKPTVDTDGNISWELSDSTTAPATQNIKGATGPAGKDGAKGATGATGANGTDGKTPVKGVDYFTEADKQEIIDAVLAALQTQE